MEPHVFITNVFAAVDADLSLTATLLLVRQKLSERDFLFTVHTTLGLKCANCHMLFYRFPSIFEPTVVLTGSLSKLPKSYFQMSFIFVLLFVSFPHHLFALGALVVVSRALGFVESEFHFIYLLITG